MIINWKNSFTRFQRINLFILLLFVLLFILIECAQGRNHSCTIKLPNDIPINEPLYLKSIRNKYEFLQFTNQTNNLPINSKLILLCHGRRNELILKPHNNNTRLICKSSNQFEDFDNKTIVNLNQMNCTKTVTSDIKITSQKCSINNQGNLYEIGYRLNSQNFLTIFQVCYNNKTETTYFSVHQIKGSTIKYAVKDNRRRSFLSIGTNTNSSTTKINQIYKKHHQIMHFKQILGENQTYFNSSMYLARGHLTPDADFILSNFQLSTYYYINVAPEFQIINAGNWLRIEYLVRNLAANFNDDFLIYTGVYEILKLKHSNNYYQEIEIYLDIDNKIPIPKWFWKAIKNLKLNTGIVFITLNNPFANYNEIQEFCPNVCDKASIKSKYFQDIKKGYTFCCEIDDFKKIVTDLPSNFTVNSLLNCANIGNLVDNLDNIK